MPYTKVNKNRQKVYIIILLQLSCSKNNSLCASFLLASNSTDYQHEGLPPHQREITKLHTSVNTDNPQTSIPENRSTNSFAATEHASLIFSKHHLNSQHINNNITDRKRYIKYLNIASAESFVDPDGEQSKAGRTNLRMPYTVWHTT